MTLLIRGGRVFDGRQFIEGDVLIRDGVIAQIGTVTADACQIVEATGMTVLPGLIDVHLHMEGISSPGWQISPEKACLPFGVTAAADASASRGDEGLLEGFPVKTGVFPIVSTKEPLSFDVTLERLARYGHRVLGLKVIYDQKANPALQDEKILEKICDFAHSRDLPVLVHTAHSPVSMAKLLDVLAPGDIATHVFCGGANSAQADGFACLKKAKQRGVILDSCICGGEHVDFSIYRNAIRAGIYPDLLGTDLAEEIAHRGGSYGLTTCMTVARLLGMPEEAVFRAVAGHAGKALRRDWGRLAVGAAADVTLLQWTDAPVDLTDRYGNRVTSEAGYRCFMTVRDGNVVFEK